MTRTQIAIAVCSLYGLIGLFVGGGLRPMLLLVVLTCGPLLLHYISNRVSKEPSNG